MEEIMIVQSCLVFFIKADSFPSGVQEAHKKLWSILPDAEERSFYGISNRDINGSIIYRAATKEMYRGEAGIYECEVFEIKKGIYLAQTLRDFPSQWPMIGNIFAEMLTDERIDDQGYCLEIYLNDRDVQCLVKLRDPQILPNA
jgi:hypothetical protein